MAVITFPVPKPVRIRLQDGAIQAMPGDMRLVDAIKQLASDGIRLTGRMRGGIWNTEPVK